MGVGSIGGVWGSKYRKVPKSGIAQFFFNLAVGVGPDVGVGSNCGGEVHWWGMGVKI